MDYGLTVQRLEATMSEVQAPLVAARFNQCVHSDQSFYSNTDEAILRI